MSDDNPKAHSLECTCETCLQNHPERDYLDDYADCQHEIEYVGGGYACKFCGMVTGTTLGDDDSAYDADGDGEGEPNV